MASFAGGALAADMPTKAERVRATFADAPRSAVWLGGAFMKDVAVGYAGGLVALNGTLDSDGFLLRGQYLYVDYGFDTTAGSADGRLHRGDILVGYQIVRNGIAGSFFVGLDYQNYKISPATADDGRLDDRAGAIFAGRLATVGNTRTPASLEGNYSTANDTYWARGRIGYNFGSVTVGPEIGALGSRTFDEARYGGYVSFDVYKNVVLQLNGGYADRIRGHSTFGSGDGGYGGVTLVLLR